MGYNMVNRGIFCTYLEFTGAHNQEDTMKFIPFIVLVIAAVMISGSNDRAAMLEASKKAYQQYAER